MDLILLIVLVSLVVGSLAYYTFGRRETIEDWVARERELGEARVIATFQRRRRWGVRLAALLVGLALVSFAAAAVTRVPRELAVFAGFTLVILSAFPLSLASRCPVCGKDPSGSTGGLPAIAFSTPESCARCFARLAPRPPTAWSREPGGRLTLGGRWRRLQITADRTRLTLVKPPLPRLLDLGLILAAAVIGYLALFAWWRWMRQPGVLGGIVTGVLAVLPPLVLGRYVVESVQAICVGDVFELDRSADRIVRNGQVLGAVSRIDEVQLQPPVAPIGNTVLYLILRGRRRIRVDASAWGDLAAVAEVLTAFVGSRLYVEDDEGNVTLKPVDSRPHVSAGHDRSTDADSE